VAQRPGRERAGLVSVHPGGCAGDARGRRGVAHRPREQLGRGEAAPGAGLQRLPGDEASRQRPRRDPPPRARRHENTSLGRSSGLPLNPPLKPSP
jgi:hypothetical protein